MLPPGYVASLPMTRCLPPDHPLEVPVRALRPALVIAITSVVLAAASPSSAATADTGFRFDFEDPAALEQRVVTDVSGNGRHGLVLSDGGGRVRAVEGFDGTTSADFPGRCSGEECPQAVVQVADDPALAPGTRPFRLGAQVRLRPHQTSPGANVVQKGLYGDPGGQWKLQVDGGQGLPSCVVSGEVDGHRQRTRVTSSVSVADGLWHQVTCSRTGTGLAVLVDGEVTGWETAAPASVTTTAPVSIGGKNVLRGTDQFHGALDEVFFTTR